MLQPIYPIPFPSVMEQQHTLADWMKLSPREMEIARLIAQGKTRKEIAAEKGLSPKTIHAHILGIRNKLSCKNNVEVANAYHGIQKQAQQTAEDFRRVDQAEFRQGLKEHVSPMEELKRYREQCRGKQ